MSNQSQGLVEEEGKEGGWMKGWDRHHQGEGTLHLSQREDGERQWNKPREEHPDTTLRLLVTFDSCKLRRARSIGNWFTLIHVFSPIVVMNWCSSAPQIQSFSLSFFLLSLSLSLAGRTSICLVARVHVWRCDRSIGAVKRVRACVTPPHTTPIPGMFISKSRRRSGR